MLEAPISFEGLHKRLDPRWAEARAELDDIACAILAVSGGPDSLAMLAGFGVLHQAGLSDTRFEVATVDHGLREEAPAEVALVQRVAAMFGFPCNAHRLEPAIERGNKQAWARRKRYAFFSALAADRNAVVLTAHTADDQAETLLMRAARGAGSEGLSGIRHRTRVAGCTIVRPFLDWRRAELRAVLVELGLEAAHDPSNIDPAYTRVRFRTWLQNAPAPDGARSVAEGFGDTARIAALESEALDEKAQCLAESVSDLDQGYVVGSCQLVSEPVAIVARVLRGFLLCVARHDKAREKLSMARMVVLAQQVQAEQKGRHVIAGSVLEWTHSGDAVALSAYAEAGRAGFPKLYIEAGQQAVWDGRFEITNETAQPVTVRAWQRGDTRAAALDLPNRVLESLPCVLRATDAQPLAGPGWSKCGVNVRLMDRGLD